VNELFEAEAQNEALRIGQRDTLEELRGILSGYDLRTCRQGISETRRGVEEWLTSRWNSVSNLQVQSTRDAELARFGRISFYLWGLFQRISCTYAPDNAYENLLRHLASADQDIGLITFNYDTFLDRALINVYGVRLETPEEYYAKRLIKIHGSVNWLTTHRSGDPHVPDGLVSDHGVFAREAANLMFTGGEIDLSSTLVIDPTNVLLKSLPSLRTHPRLSGNYFYPFILMPLTDKLYGRLKGHQETLVSKARELIQQASEIFVIGYRAADQLFQGLIKNAQRVPVHVVSHGDAEEIMKHVVWASGNRVKPGSVNDKGFLQFVNTYR